MITPELEPRLYAALASKCRELNCPPLAIGGVADHLHLLVRLNASIPVAQLVKELKGASSHLVTHEITPDEFFKWQGGYAVFSVGLEGLEAVKAYIQNQKQHHATGNLRPTWES